MSKRRKRRDNPDQLSIFDLIKRLQESPSESSQGSMNIQAPFKGILTECIKHCSLSRWEIAGKMSNLLGTEITKYMLDTWTAESKEYHRIPAEYLPAFCEAVGSREPLRFLGQKSGVFVLREGKVLRAERAEIERKRKELNQKLKQIDFLLRVTEASTHG